MQVLRITSSREELLFCSDVDEVSGSTKKYQKKVK